MEADAFQQSFGLLPEPTVLLSVSGEVLACNRPVYDLFGYQRGAYLPGTAIHDIVADPALKVDRFLRLCRRSRELLPGALTCKTASGSQVLCRVEGALLTPPSENKPGALLLRLFPKQTTQSKFLVLNERIDLLHREILERRQAQARLYAEREWLRTTLASIGDAVIATDNEGRIVFMNIVAELLTGWSQADATGQPLASAFRIINEESREPVENPVTAVLTQGVIVGLANHTLLISRDGTERLIADSGAPIRDESGRMIGVVLVFRDVTDAQRSQSLIVQSERRFRRIFDTAHVAIWEQDFSKARKELLALQRQGVVDLRSYLSEHPEFLQRAVQQIRIVDANLAAVELFEAENKNELITSIASVFVPGAYAVFAEVLLAMAQGKSAFQSEAPLVSFRGKPLQVLFALTFPPDDPTLSTVLVSLMNITDRKHAEEALRRANEALRRANSDLEHFAYAAAHDLQEPLRNVVLYTQMLQRRYSDNLDAKGREACRISVEGAQRMQALVQGLLDYTRVVSDSEMEMDMDAESALDCARILASVKENLRTSIEEAHAKIICDKLPIVNARDTHLLQLFQNLLSNAIKYRKPGQDAVIHITARQELGEWIFLVEDNGVGVPPEYQTRIFEAFKRLHGREIPGVGMGLTICSRIVAHYGGRMWVESQKDRGSTFAFTLPEHGRR
jgi:PAS domain S-box-containing protein